MNLLKLQVNALNIMGAKLELDTQSKFPILTIMLCNLWRFVIAFAYQHSTHTKNTKDVKIMALPPILSLYEEDL